MESLFKIKIICDRCPCLSVEFGDCNLNYTTDFVGILKSSPEEALNRRELLSKPKEEWYDVVASPDCKLIAIELEDEIITINDKRFKLSSFPLTIYKDEDNEN